MTDEEYMKVAIGLAEKAFKKDDVPIGCVIVKDGRIIAEGYNKKEKKGNPLCHAEIIAINKAVKKIGDWRLNGCTLYVTLEPCPMCAGAIAGARVSRVVFGAYEPKSGCAGSLYDILSESGLNHKVECLGGVLKEECSELIKKYFASKRKAKE